MLQNQPQLKGQDQIEFLLLEMEKYITVKLFKYVYPRTASVVDQAFQLTCECFQWVTFSHLDIPCKVRNHHLCALAVHKLHSLHQEHSTVDKMFHLT